MTIMLLKHILQTRLCSPLNMPNFQMAVLRLLLLTLMVLATFHISPCLSQSSDILHYNVPEEKEAGLFVGDISSDHNSTGPYFYLGLSEWFDLTQSGRITTKKPLDREDPLNREHTIVAIPSYDQSHHVTIQITVTDENDNAPQFPRSIIVLEFSEAVNVGTIRTLDSASDPDLQTNSVVGYNIINGNTDDSFSIETRSAPGDEDTLQLDLVVNRELDRETIPHYDIVIEAFDGGSPQLRSYLNVSIDILDINDNRPVLVQSNFSISLPESFRVDSLILQLNASDRDAGANGVVIYEVWEYTNPTETFRIDSATGKIFLNKQLNSETMPLYRIVVTARDNGTTPNEEQAFISIEVVNDLQQPPTINILFTSGDGTPKVSEAALVGDFVARISIDDPDSAIEDIDVEVTGGENQFDLRTRDNIIYLICIAEPLDREQMDSYHLVVRATDQSDPPLTAEEEFTLIVEDVNDNQPVFLNTPYTVSKSESSVNGTLVLRVTATDTDLGMNAEIRYSILNVNEPFIDWFVIDRESGMITTMNLLDRELTSELVVTVMASDLGVPPLNSVINISVTITDVNDNHPKFLADSYKTGIPEDTAQGSCFYQVQANDADLTSAGHVTYTIEAVPGLAYPSQFSVQRNTGNICTTQVLDRDDDETSFQFRVKATDEGGLYSVVPVTVSLIDVNDNRPEFYPETVAVDIYDYSQQDTDVATVTAEDRDSGLFGAITYRIESGNRDGAFRIDPSIGDITVAGALDRRQTNMYALEVSATDGGGHSSLVNARVTVSIIGPDDPRPVFDRSKYSFTISEGAAHLEEVGTVRARNADAGNLSPIQYSIQSGDPDGFFSVNRSAGIISVKSTLDRETRRFVLLNVQASSGSPVAHASAQVNITIEDVNDNAPLFKTSVPFTHIDENKELGSVVFIASATDPDDGANGEVRYHLVDNPGEFFSITPVSGRVQLVRAVSYDEQKKHTILIRAFDLGLPEMDTNLTVNIYISDVNNHGPQFDPRSYQKTVSEGTGIGERILQVRATDNDTGTNAEITYSLSPRAAASRFGIFPDTGWIYLHHRLDYELGVEYLLEVVATDRGEDPKSSTAVVHVIVADINDNAPQFDREIYTFTADEDWNAGSEIGTVIARDIDSGDNGRVEYTLSSDGPFTIGRGTGFITTTSTLDYEEQASYKLTVTASDDGNPQMSTSATVILQVNDLNDNAPVFLHSRYRASVREEEPTETAVVRVLATDADSDAYGDVTYSLNPGVPEFQIDSSSGLITTARVLDRETLDRYTLRVTASDGGTPSRVSSTTVEVKVKDQNDNEPLVAGGNYTFDVDESLTPGSVIGTIEAFDPDAGQNGLLYYSIVEGNIFGMFSINRTTGSLLNIREVDYEVAARHQLKVLVEDQGSIRPRSVDVFVTINVIDENDNAPVFPINPVFIAVVENVPIGSTLWTFQARDADAGSNGVVRYRLSPEQTQLRIDPVSGILSSIAAVDREAVEEFRFTVVAEDQAIGASQRRTNISVICIVADENDNSPSFSSRSITHIMEDEPIGYPVIHVTAEDGDAGINGRVVYQIVHGNEDGKFTLGPDTGLLTVAHSLDHEHRQRYDLNITARDMGPVPRASWQVLEVHVEDVNDQPPVFDRLSYVFNVTEEQRPGVIVGRVMAVDMDSGVNGELTYEFPEGIVSSQFQIDSSTGVITTSAQLDGEEQDTYSLTVYVMDGAFPAHYDVTTVTVYVEDINDNPPMFAIEEYSLTIPEAQPTGVIHIVTASDPDVISTGGILYQISDGNSDGSFDLDVQTGELSTVHLDRETTPSYDLTISAIDGINSQLSDTMVIHVNVSDVNDNDPMFERRVYSAEIAEDDSIGTSVVTVQATDRDIGKNGAIRYSIDADEQMQRLFVVDRDTGEITTTGTFDFEKAGTHTFQVRAADQGAYAPRSEQVQVTVTITDVNDNAPVFTNSPIRATLRVGYPANQMVATLLAEDKDSGSNGEVHFRFTESAPFHILGQVVTTSQALNTETFYRLTVEAFDSGEPSLTATAILEVWVTDSSPYMLTFSAPSYQATVSEDAEAGSTVQMVRLQNAPSGVTFTIASGNQRGAFELSSSSEESGVATITVRDASSLDYETNRVIVLIVEAEAPSPSSGQAFPLYGYTTINVSLQDANDNAPQFTQDRYSTSVMEGSASDVFVMQVIASDADEGANAEISYHIVGGNTKNLFAVDMTTGILMTNGPLDREVEDIYRLTLQARDNGNPRRNDTVVVKITINDDNDNRPTFPVQEPVSISEGLEIGSVVTTLEAEDPDIVPTITYSFSAGGNLGSMFNIDAYSGTLTLAEPLDRERQSEYELVITASDGVHTEETSLRVIVLDENDNVPVFMQQSYQVTVPELTERGHSVIQVNATDEDIRQNAAIAYTIGVQPSQGYSIDAATGEITTDQRIEYDASQPLIQLVITATDGGTPPLSQVVAVRIQILDINNNAPEFTQEIYMGAVSEGAVEDTPVVTVTASDNDVHFVNQKIDYSIVSGDEENQFFISRDSGDIRVYSPLDRETEEVYTLTVMASDRGSPQRNATAEVVIQVLDVNDHAPVFSPAEYSGEISEGAEIGDRVLRVTTYDLDKDANGEVTYDIVSGDSQGFFAIGRQNGWITVKGALDHERVPEVELVVMAADRGTNSSSGTVVVYINITDVNDNRPYFPVMMYLERLPENRPPGPVFTARALDKDRGIYGKLEYTITGGSGHDFFSIDQETGVVSSLREFDYEAVRSYLLIIRAADIGQESERVQAQVSITGVDEYRPDFENANYNFGVSSDASIGNVIGQVSATDEDAGPDGVVLYEFQDVHEHFTINDTTGVITVKEPFSGGGTQRVKRAADNYPFIIVAKSGKPDSLETQVAATIQVQAAGIPSLIIILMGTAFFILIIVVVCFFVALLKMKRKEGKEDPRDDTKLDAGSPRRYDATFDRHIEMGHGGIMNPNITENHMMRAGYSHQGVYRVPTSNSSMDVGHLTKTDVSDQSHSASSGRGSATVEDEEICQINERTVPRQPRDILDSGIQPDHEDGSCRNSASDLNSPRGKPFSTSVESMHVFGEEGGGEAGGQIRHLIYAQLDEGITDEDIAIVDGKNVFGYNSDGQPSMGGSLSSIVNGQEELSGSYNWDYLLDWGPQFQPLAAVFAEIAKLKDDNFVPRKETYQFHQKAFQPLNKTYPPPLITNVVQGQIKQLNPSVEHKNAMNHSHMNNLPRSPINYDNSSIPSAVTPDLSPSLSPLAPGTMSPLVTSTGVSSTQSSRPSSGSKTFGDTRGSQGQRMVTFQPPLSHADEIQI